MSPIAVVLDPSGGEHGPRLAAAVGPHAASLSLGGLAAARSGKAAAGAFGSVSALLAGELYDLDALGESVGAPPGGRAEDLAARAYATLGRSFVDRLRGAFVLLVWDATARRGLLVRDHLGEQSLLLHRAGRTLTAATEVRVLTSLLRARPAPDLRSVAWWLATTSVPGDATFHEGVTRLPPGWLLELEGDRATPRRWWAPRFGEPQRIPRDEAVDRVRGAVLTAVRRRIGPGEPVGLLLSGGLDSGTLAAVQARSLEPSRRTVTAYSVLFPDYAGLDESALIDGLQEGLDLPATNLTVRSGSVLGGIVAATSEWRVPVISPNVFYQRPQAQRMRQEGMAAMMDGEGGDEVFAASRYLLADLVAGGRPLRALRMAARFPGAGHRPRPRSVMRFWRRYGVAGALPQAVIRRRRALAAGQRRAPPWLRPAFARHVDPVAMEFAWGALDGPRWWRYLAWTNTGNYEALGAFEHFRHRAEGAGLRSRHPLRDVDLLELALSLPPEAAWDPLRDRPLLRDAMAGTVPDAVRLRPGKARFDALYVHNVVGEGRIIRRLLGRRDAEVLALVPREALERRLLDVDPREHHRGVVGWTDDAFRLAVIETWLRSEADPALPSRLLAGEPLPPLDATFATRSARSSFS